MLKPDHITINVKDMKKSEVFYGEILGLRKLDIVDMGDHRLHYYELSEGLLLELIEYDDDLGELHPNVKTRGIYWAVMMWMLCIKSLRTGVSGSSLHRMMFQSFAFAIYWLRILMGSSLNL